MHDCYANLTNFISGGANNLPENEEHKTFYALGINIARQVGGEIKGLVDQQEMEVLLKGFSDSMSNQIPDERSILMTYGPKLNEILNGRASKVITAEKQKGEEYVAKYLLENPKAIQLPSGLVFHEQVAGIGAQATLDSTVLVHYHGTLSDGTIFDSSVDRGEPIKFPLRNVIKGWQEGVALLKVGGKATLVIPAQLAYGDSGSPPVIPPGATLRFEVELLEVTAA